jgi:hypothetical protein
MEHGGQYEKLIADRFRELICSLGQVLREADAFSFSHNDYPPQLEYGEREKQGNEDYRDE